jgi:hypothetical protein
VRAARADCRAWRGNRPRQCEAGDAIEVVTACAQHHDADVHAAASQLATQIEAAAIWKREVEHDHLECISRQFCRCSGTRACGTHFEPVACEVFGEHRAQPRVVIDDEHAASRLRRPWRQKSVTHGYTS